MNIVVIQKSAFVILVNVLKKISANVAIMVKKLLTILLLLGVSVSTSGCSWIITYLSMLSF